MNYFPFIPQQLGDDGGKPLPPEVDSENELLANIETSFIL